MLGYTCVGMDFCSGDQREGERVRLYVEGIRWALRCLQTYRACARRVLGRDVGSKWEFVGLRDPSESRAPGHFRAGRACPPALKHHPLQQMLRGPFADPLTSKAPRPTPHPGPRRRDVGEGRGAGPLLCAPPGSVAPRRPHFPAGLAASLPPPPPSQPPRKYIVFSPNPVQLQHNKTHNKNLIHFSPAPPSPGISRLGIKNLSSCLWHRSPDASASLMDEPGSWGPAASAV